MLGLSALPLGLRLQLLTVPVHFRLLGRPAYRRIARAARVARRRLPGRRERRVALDGVDLFLPLDRSFADLGTLYEVFVSEDYRTEYQDAVVVDLGAHKGFFAGYALLSGAAAVVSYEPASANFEPLSRAAASLNGRGRGRWRAVNAAVGARDGTVELHTSRDSWTHSVVDRPGMMVGTETSQVVPMSRVLAEARALTPSRLVVKIDVEGAECEIVEGTPPEAWDGVDELFVEVHGFARCSPAALVDRLARAGLHTDDPVPVGGLQDEFSHAVLRFRRAELPISG